MKQLVDLGRLNNVQRSITHVRIDPRKRSVLIIHLLHPGTIFKSVKVGLGKSNGELFSTGTRLAQTIDLEGKVSYNRPVQHFKEYFVESDFGCILWLIC